MGVPYAEVIGDPIAHSKSPLIHHFWLKKLDLKGEYRIQRVRPGELKDYIASRCADPFWRGCNVAMPLKPLAAQLVADPTGSCTRIGAANAIVRSPLGCGIGANTDVHGLAGAVGQASTRRATILGAGGGARSALEYLRVRGGGEVSLLVRDAAKAAPVHRSFVNSGSVYSFGEAAEALEGADLIINATPLGMDGGEEMPADLLDALAATAPDAWLFDMVYVPHETEFLRRGRQFGRHIADGLVMLVGQAAAAFELFFGAPAPREHDSELRELLTR